MNERRGLLFGSAAYLLWGFFPLYFKLLARSGAVEIVAHRAAWSFVFCLLLLVVLRRWDTLVTALRHGRTVLLLGCAGLLVAVNWSVYVWAVQTERTIDAALGYFITPLVSALLGVAFLRERLRPLQWVAFLFGAAAVVVLVAGLRAFPTVALSLATSFGVYALVKKQAGSRVEALPGLTIETMAITPVAVGYLAWLAQRGEATVTPGGYGLLVAAAGVITAVPLLLFAAAAARISMVAIGMLQYLSPVLQFLTGWLLFGEPMPTQRWAGFLLVWVALAFFAVDGVRRQQAARRFERAAHTHPVA